MSLYNLNRIMYLLDVDADFLAGMRTEPAETIKHMELTDEERAAVLSGDVGKLYRFGVNMFMLDSIAKHELFGLNRERYLAAIRAAAQAEAGKPGTLQGRAG